MFKIDINNKVTIKDVAARAGVSTATVSNVINNSTLVKEKTKELVLKTIKELNYHPDRVARGFKTGKTHTIGLIVPDISNNFFASLMENIESILKEKNYQVLVANTHESAENELDSIKLFTSGMVDGLIIASSMTEYKPLEGVLPKNGRIPVVFLERSVNNCPFDSVMISDFASTAQSVEYLIENGHKKIGFLYGINTISPCIERLNAYKATLLKHNIQADDRYIKNVPSYAFGEIKNLIDGGCTAIVASTNKVTIDAIMYYLNNGISFDKIQLVGYLNDDFASESMTNMLSVLHPIKELASHAVKLLFNRMANPSSNIKNTVLLSRFVKPQNTK